MQYSQMSSDKSAQDGRMTRKTPRDRPYIPQYDRSTNEQDRFLDYCQRNKCLVTVILESGLALQGMVVEHDRKALMLGPMRSNKDVRFISKSYISLIRASEVLPLFLEYRGKGTHLTRKKGKRALVRAALEARGEAPRVQRKLRQPAERPPTQGNKDSADAVPSEKPAVKVTTKRRRAADCSGPTEKLALRPKSEGESS